MFRPAWLLFVTLALTGCSHEKIAPAPDQTASKSPRDAATVPTGSDEAAPRAECCRQCTAAGQRDPAGMDISTKDCRSYAGQFNGGPGVDERCLAYFEGTKTTLGECWKLK